MNRRSFLETLAKAAAGFTILPSALTYSRVWRAQKVVDVSKLPGFWYQTKRQVFVFNAEYAKALELACWETIFLNKRIPEFLVGDLVINEETNEHQFFNGKRLVRL